MGFNDTIDLTNTGFIPNWINCDSISFYFYQHHACTRIQLAIGSE